MCHNQPADIIPIVFGHTGIVSCCQENYLKKSLCFSDSLFQQLQQAALLGTISILRDNNFTFDATLAILLVHHLISVLLYMCIHFNEIQ